MAYFIDSNGLLWVLDDTGAYPAAQVPDELELTDYDRDLLRGMKIAPPEAA